MKIQERRLLELLDRRSIEQTVRPGSTVLIAVSGGADSVALLRAMHLYSPTKKLKLAVVHVNHGIRAESDSEAQFVTELCDSLGIPHNYEKLSLGPKPKNLSPEEYWRTERYRVFSKVLRQLHADFVALGQTADDLAESFLYHLTRGTGPEGLVFHFLKHVEPENMPIVRPLWKTRRVDVEAALCGVNQDWITDPSNADVQYSRNRIRKEVIPALEIINPGAVTAIVNLADKLATTLENDNVTTRPDSQAILELPQSLRDAPHALIGKAIRQFLKDGHVMHTARHLEQAADMVHEGSSGIVALPDSLSLVVTQNIIWIYRGADPSNLDLAREHCCRLSAFAADLSELPTKSGSNITEITALNGQRYMITLSTHDSVIIRNRRSGDRIGPKTLKKLLIDYRVPWYLRDYLVLAATPEGQVVDIITELKPLKNWITSHSSALVTLEYSNASPSA